MTNFPTPSNDTGQERDEEGQTRLADNQFYRALAAEDRRRLLYYMLEHEQSTMEELATVLSGWEATTTGAMKSERDRNRFRSILKHQHLPLLSDAGLISYHPEDDTVTLKSLTPLVRDILGLSFEMGELEQL